MIGTRGWRPGKHSRSLLGSVEDVGATRCSFLVEVDNYLGRAEIRPLISRTETYALGRYMAVYILILRSIASDAISFEMESWWCMVLSLIHGSHHSRDELRFTKPPVPEYLKEKLANDCPDFVYTFIAYPVML